MVKSDYPDIILFITDQQSADAVGCSNTGHFLATPTIDRLVREGSWYDRAYCSYPLCVPSRASMFTGCFPHQLGVMDNKDRFRDISAFPSLGKTFADAGYATGYVGKWHLPYPFEAEEQHGFEFLAAQSDKDADKTEAAITFLQQERQRPAFLVVSYNNPHNICEWARGDSLPDVDIGPPPPPEDCPPLKSNHFPPEDEIEILARLRRLYHSSTRTPVGNFGEKEWRQYLWAYYRMIESVDREMAKIMDELEKDGVRDDTAIVFLSDHGDAQGAHRWNQKTVFFDESSRVPLIIVPPASEKREQTVSYPVQTGTDLLPTLCGLAGIRPPSGLNGVDVREGTQLQARPYIAAETRFGMELNEKGKVTKDRRHVNGRMIRSSRYKYCVYDTGDPNETLVDMDTDPGETVNLAADSDFRRVLHQHRQYLAEFMQNTNDEFRPGSSKSGKVSLRG